MFALPASLNPLEKARSNWVDSINPVADSCFAATRQPFCPIVLWPTESGLWQRHELALVRSKRAREICSSKKRHHQRNSYSHLLAHCAAGLCPDAFDRQETQNCDRTTNNANSTDHHND